jgi:hypothetical protein
VLYKVHGGFEKLTFSCKFPSAAPVAAPLCLHGKQLASARRRDHDKRRRKAWLEKKKN